MNTQTSTFGFKWTTDREEKYQSIFDEEQFLNLLREMAGKVKMDDTAKSRIKDFLLSKI